MRNPFHRPEPTPLEIAAHELVGAQVALLTAHDKQERADAEVSMFIARIARLRVTIRELTAEAAAEVTPCGQGAIFGGAAREREVAP